MCVVCARLIAVISLHMGIGVLDVKSQLCVLIECPELMACPGRCPNGVS